MCTGQSAAATAGSAACAAKSAAASAASSSCGAQRSAGESRSDTLWWGPSARSMPLMTRGSTDASSWMRRPLAANSAHRPRRGCTAKASTSSTRYASPRAPTSQSHSTRT